MKKDYKKGWWSGLEGELGEVPYRESNTRNGSGLSHMSV